MDVAAAWRLWVSDTARTGTAPVGVVEAAVGAAGFAGHALAVERVTHGELNEVYRVGREDGPRMIVRLSRQVPSTFPRERWAIAAAAQGVPVPDVLLLDEVEAGGERLSVCVLSDLGGRPLQDVAGDPQAPGHDAVAELAREAGRALARVHAAVAGGFGFLSVWRMRWSQSCCVIAAYKRSH